MPAEKRPRHRTDNWLRDALPHYRTYQTIGQGYRSAFFTQLSGDTGLAENTLRRQMAALAYLESKRLDLETLIDICPPVMAIEAVARIGKVSAAGERKNLDRLLAGHGTVAEYLAEAKRFEASASKPPDLLPRVKLSEILSRDLFSKAELRRPQEPGEGSWAEFDFQLWFVSGPYLTVDQGPGRVVDIIVADHKGAPTSARIAEQIELTVLRSLVTNDRTILCIDMEFGQLDETLRRMKPELREKLFVWRCTVDLDLPDRSGKRSVWALSQPSG
ncbi:hypothetical protein BIWAKO_02811 [Bosea sp. BIWAKO-01]|nr:hypothetical protein BIWAKO_02811 [Bosea sp. BIWAKO-01]